MIIPTVGRTFLARNMVMLLQAGTRRPDEIIVVEQIESTARNPVAFTNLRRLAAKGCCPIIEHPVKSLTVARNVGIAATDADLIIFVNYDAFLPPNFIRAYHELFEESDLDATTGMILAQKSDEGSFDRTQTRPSEHDRQTMVRGGNFAVRRAVVHAIGGLDENFVGAANHEDADLAYRLHQHGSKVLWDPGPWLFHLSYTGGGGRIDNPPRHRNFAFNLCYFYLRHHKKIIPALWASLLRWWVFSRANVTYPWTLPCRLRNVIAGYRLARAAVASGPRLPMSPLTLGNF